MMTTRRRYFIILMPIFILFAYATLCIVYRNRYDLTYRWCPFVNLGSCRLPDIWKTPSLLGATRAEVYKTLGNPTMADMGIKFFAEWWLGDKQDWVLVIQFDEPTKDKTLNDIISNHIFILRKDIFDRRVMFNLP